MLYASSLSSIHAKLFMAYRSYSAATTSPKEYDEEYDEEYKQKPLIHGSGLLLHGSPKLKKSRVPVEQLLI